MRAFAFAFALFALAWAQDPTPTRTSVIPSEITVKTWATAATTKLPTVPSYSAPATSYTTITSGSVIYQVAVPPKGGSTIAWTKITSGGGVWSIPITEHSVPIATAAPSEGSQNTHKTRTIILSVIFSFIGAVALIMATMFAMRIRAQRRMRDHRSWATRPGGWVNESKDAHQFDTEIGTVRSSFPEPQVPAPAPTHTRQRSL